MDTEPAEIVIRFDAGARPITGEVSAGTANPREFTGWAGLFAVLRAATAEQHKTLGGSPGAPGAGIGQ
jgi:hypothetical protein